MSNLNSRRQITVVASAEGIEQADNALVRLGFESKANFAECKLLSRSSVTKFFNRESLRPDTFKKICEILKLDWEKMLDSGSLIPINDQQGSSIQGISRQITVIDKQNEVQANIVLIGDITSIEFDFKTTLEVLLKEYGGCTIQVTNIRAGSIRVTIKGSQQDVQRLIDRFAAGELTELNGFSLEEIQLLEGVLSNTSEASSSPNKRDVTQEIVGDTRKNRKLSNADLSDADLNSGVLCAVKASTQGLEVIDRLRKQKGWNRQSHAWCQTAFTTVTTLKRFWSGESIQQDTFARICQAVGMEQWETIVEGVFPTAQITSVQLDGMPDVSIFYGRTEELVELTHLIVENRCRLVVLLGMGGIGKSALAAKLAEQIQPQFECLIWRSLRYKPPIEALLADLLQLLAARFPGDRQPLADSEPLTGKISSLIDYLLHHRILLVLDGLEAVLSSGDFAGHYREGYKSYGDLIERIGNESHQSCLLLTSREKTPEIALLEGRTAPVRSIDLLGLREAAREILITKELTGEEQWNRLIQIYRGNPLVLQVIATFVKELFGGNVAAFLMQGMTLVTGDLSGFLKQLFDRLSPLESRVMHQLAQAQKPMRLEALREALPDVKEQVLLALQSLWWRSLIEINAFSEFTLQPVVAEYTIHYLRWASGEENKM